MPKTPNSKMPSGPSDETIIEEGKLVFRFQSCWKAVKYDRPGGFAESVKIESTKKIDIVALSEQKLMLIEIKDFRGSEPDNQNRLSKDSSDPIHVEIAQKVRDTIAVLLAAYRTQDTELCPMADYLFHKERKPVEVVFFLERDPQTQEKLTGYRSTSNIRTKLVDQLRPFKVACSVQNLLDSKSKHGTGWRVANRPNENSR